MLNEFGVELDSSGYAPSLLSKECRCFNCKRTNGKLDRHEIFHGSLRNKSKRLGLWVLLCHDCHEDLHSGRNDLNKTLKPIAEAVALARYAWTIEDFRYEFGKNYIEEPPQFEGTYNDLARIKLCFR